MRKFFLRRLFSHYDAIVVGGGSAGIAFAKEYSNDGKSVAVLDFTIPSIHDSTWGLGGTCVNVGCVPKKFFHYSSIKNPNLWSEGYGYLGNGTPVEKDWNSLVQNIQMYIQMANFKTRGSLFENEIDFFPSYGKFVDNNTIKFEKDGEVETITGDSIVIATGLRPKVLDIPGSELAITSSELFSSNSVDPGETLLIGGSFIALESAGCLEDKATVMVRELCLRGFDRQCAEFVEEDMKEWCGTTFLKNCVPVEISETQDDRLQISYLQCARNEGGEICNSELHSLVFDTIMFCVGRETSDLVKMEMNIDTIGLELDEDGKFGVDQYHRTNVDNVFAIGDCNNLGRELTTVASLQGRTLAEYLQGNEKVIDYEFIPVTSFLPLEYGFIGYTEEEATLEFEEVEVYYQTIDLMEYAVTDQMERKGFIKIVCVKDEQGEEVVKGFNVIAPYACEITQGFSTAMRLGMTKRDLDETIGIHPSVAEKLTLMKKDKTSDGSC